MIVLDIAKIYNWQPRHEDFVVIRTLKGGIAMKAATLAQGNQILNLTLQKKVLANRLRDLIESGFLADLLDANVGEIDRRKFFWGIGLKWRAMEKEPRTSTHGMCATCKKVYNLCRNPWPGEVCDKEGYLLPTHLAQDLTLKLTGIGIPCLGIGVMCTHIWRI